jgi:hypothetical protein
MRDGSMEDMANFWIGHIMEKSDWAPASNVYLAIIRQAADRYVEANRCAYFGPAAVTKLDDLLNEILAALPEIPEEHLKMDGISAWFPPVAINLMQRRPEAAEKQYAYYWTTDMWKRDFLTALESQFWVYRNYAHGAGKGKMAFLRDLAEVWIAAATTALVRYADNDNRVWRNTAKLLRRIADMVETDGLRALSWGPWGHALRDVPERVEPELGDS